MIFVKHTRAANRQCPVVLRASIITPEAREVADLLGFTITECDESIPVTASVPASVPADKTESQRIRETIIAQLPEGQLPKAWSHS
ncbi:ethanolamine utilization protein [Escherichia coli]|uniref:Ethanolamine utilization protein n=1 Tax=Escherichia coli TaxID=562 RepID=A0A376RFY2_ECOLX|nr:ethanolamine utilization protein [Escherichia coli]